MFAFIAYATVDLYVFSNPNVFPNAFLYIYVYPIIFFCGTFAIDLSIRLVRARCLTAFLWCLLAGISGAGGLAAAVAGDHWFCERAPMWISAQAIWYITSDISMAALAKAYIATARRTDQVRDASDQHRPLFASAGDSDLESEICMAD